MARALVAAMVMLLPSVALAADCPTRIRGVVLDARGAPAIAAVATARTDGRLHAQIVTDATGDFVFVDLAPGRYEVCVAVNVGITSSFSCRGRVDVACGIGKELTFRLDDPEPSSVFPLVPVPEVTCDGCAEDSRQLLMNVVGLWRAPCGRLALFKTPEGSLRSQITEGELEGATGWAEARVCACGSILRFRSLLDSLPCMAGKNEYTLSPGGANDAMLVPVSSSAGDAVFTRVEPRPR